MSNSVSQNELVEIVIGYRYELQKQYKSMVGAIKRGKGSAKTSYHAKLIEKKLARIDRVLNEVGR